MKKISRKAVTGTAAVLGSAGMLIGAASSLSGGHESASRQVVATETTSPSADTLKEVSGFVIKAANEAESSVAVVTTTPTTLDTAPVDKTDTKQTQTAVTPSEGLIDTAEQPLPIEQARINAAAQIAFVKAGNSWETKCIGAGTVLVSNTDPSQTVILTNPAALLDKYPGHDDNAAGPNTFAVSFDNPSALTPDVIDLAVMHPSQPTTASTCTFGWDKATSNFTFALALPASE